MVWYGDDEDSEEKENHPVKLFLEALEGSELKRMGSTGDCFYEAIVTAFNMENKDVRDYDDVVKEATDDKVKALRRTAAMFLTEEVFQKFQMSHSAGLVDYKFMSEMDSIEKLQEKMILSGREVGIMNCLWANEFEIRVVCQALHVCCLVWDCSARKEVDRLVKVGEEVEQFIILKKVGEHYNLIYREEEGERHGVFTKEDLSEEALQFWGLGLR